MWISIHSAEVAWFFGTVIMHEATSMVGAR